MATQKPILKFVVVLAAMAVTVSARISLGAPPVGPVTRPASRPTNDIFARSNLVAWCIVPYDGKQRTPEQRAEMLSRIGLRKFSYDWRTKQLPGFDTELDELQKRGIELTGIWFPDSLNKDARYLLGCLAKHHVHTQLWVSSWANYGNGQDARVKAAAERMRVIAEEAGKIGCTLGLYNHGGWFGEPENEIAIIERLKNEGINNVGIVYSLHHGYGDLDRFSELFNKMVPYLLDVNLNGMTKISPRGGEPVVPVGQGTLDVSLLKVIRDSGYAGPIGIINESSEDAELRLLDNIDGVNWLVPQLDGKPAGERPRPRSWRQPK
ncbi:MAG TPA: TIM barrel protein [Tepidisphaeraceae bacterium]|nr:TIM barrel protein [Tepidisphaeraceae bacterium]